MGHRIGLRILFYSRAAEIENIREDVILVLSSVAPVIFGASSPIAGAGSEADRKADGICFTGNIQNPQVNYSLKV